MNVHEAQCKLAGAHEAASAAVHQEVVLAAQVLWLELRAIAEQYEALQAVELECEWESDKGYFFEIASLCAIAPDDEGEVEDLVSDVQAWGTDAARLMFGLTDDQDHGRVTRDELLAREEWSEERT